MDESDRSTIELNECQIKVFDWIKACCPNSVYTATPLQGSFDQLVARGLHDFFATSEVLTDNEALAHRKEIAKAPFSASVSWPSL